MSEKLRGECDFRAGLLIGSQRMSGSQRTQFLSMPRSMWTPWFTSRGCKMVPHLQLTSWKVPVEWKRLPPTSDVTASLFLGWTLCPRLKDCLREGNAELCVTSSTSHIPLWKEMGRPEFSKEVRVLYQKKAWQMLGGPRITNAGCNIGDISCFPLCDHFVILHLLWNA